MNDVRSAFEPGPVMTKMSRREIARHVCKDCPANVIEIGEYYLVSPQLWEDKLHLKWDDNLCIGCLENSPWPQAAGTRPHHVAN